ncbi:MAG: NINE protein, partial [Coleofasciculaceae cyanobacterium SM2_3_26]|nr:NINE protein [Coleofasciculaceae cyanobacterium SM2_3_26]
MRSKKTAYLLWLPGLVGLCGLQRLYVGEWFGGLLWLFTFGLLGIGQLLDLALIPMLVDRFNQTEIFHGMMADRPEDEELVWQRLIDLVWQHPT